MTNLAPETISGWVRDIVGKAPTPYGPQPWELHVTQEVVELRAAALPLAVLPQAGERDRLIATGTAAATAQLALRHLGLRTSLALLPDQAQPDLLARLTVTGHADPTNHENALFAAISRRHSYRMPFSHTPVDPALSAALIRQSAAENGDAIPHVQLLPLHDAAIEELSRLLSYGGNVVRADFGYQRELAAWGAPEPPQELDTLPWGMVRRTTHLPDEATLAARLEAETVLLVLTADDAHVDHLRAGVVLQRAWLAAVAAGLVASVHTQVLQLPEVRAGLIERLGLAGYPQLIMRLGNPAALTDVAKPRSEHHVGEAR